MADLVPLDRAKVHLAIAAGDSAQDEYLRSLIDVALRTIEHRTGQGFIGGAETLKAADLAIVGHAALLLIGTWYANRESVVAGQAASELPHGVAMLLEPLRIWTV